MSLAGKYQRKFRTLNRGCIGREGRENGGYDFLDLKQVHIRDGDRMDVPVSGTVRELQYIAFSNLMISEFQL
jgi:hypothetical protein